MDITFMQILFIIVLCVVCYAMGLMRGEKRASQEIHDNAHLRRILHDQGRAIEALIEQNVKATKAMKGEL